VTLTELDVFTLDLLQVFQGQDLRFGVSQPLPDTGTVGLNDQRGTSLQSLEIPPPYSSPAYQPMTNGSFVCLESRCVTFGGSVIKVFSENQLVWADKVVGTVEAATLFKAGQVIVCASVATGKTREILVWQLSNGQPTAYNGTELQSLQTVNLRATSNSAFSELVVFGSTGLQDELYVYVVDPVACSLYGGQRVPGLEAIVEVQPYYGWSFLVLDRIAGLVEVEPTGFLVFTSAKGKIEGNLLGMSVSIDHKVAVQTTDELLFLGTETLQVLAHLSLRLPAASLWMLEDVVVLLTPEQGYVVEKDRARVLFSFSTVSHTFGFGCWAADKQVEIFQEDGMNAYVTTVQSSPVELQLSSTLASYSLQLVATSLLHGLSTVLVLQVFHLNATDSKIYFGSGFQLSPEAQELKYDSYFSANFSGLRIPLGNLFSGPALNYSVTIQGMQPATHLMFLVLEQSLIQSNAPYSLLQVKAKPKFGCNVQAQPSLFVAFSDRYVVLISVEADVEMRSVELPVEPLRCVAHGSVLWVYCKESLFRLLVQLDPFALALVSTETLDFDCEHIISNAKFCLCYNAISVLVSLLDSDTNVTFTSLSVSTPHQPFNLTSSCFLGETSSQLLLADINNGLNVVNLNAVLEGGQVPFVMQLRPAVAVNTTVHFSQDKLVVMSTNIEIFHFRGQALELIMTVPQGPGRDPCWEVLVDNLLYVNQESYLNVYNLNTSMHQALYVSLPLLTTSEFLVFSIGAAHSLLRLSTLSKSDYNLTNYLVVQPDSGPAVEVGVACEGCLQTQDLHLNLTITASNSFAQASRLLQITMVNKGSFASVKAAPPAFHTLATDKNWSLPLLGLFEGNELDFSLEVNGLPSTGPVNLEGGIEEGPGLYLNYCTDLQSFNGRIYCLSGQNLTVLEMDSNFTIKAKLPLIDNLNQCSALALVRSEGSKVLLAVACSQDENATDLKKLEENVAIFLVYDHEEEREKNRTVLPLTSNCDYVKVGRRSKHSASLFCLCTTHLSFAIQEYTLDWTSDFKQVTMGQGRLLAPSNTNLSSFLPYSFDVNNSQDSFTLLVAEKKEGLVLLEPKLHDYQVAAKVSKEVLDAHASNDTFAAFFCGGKVLVTKGSHVLLFNWTGEFEWTRTIYPFSIAGEAAYLNTVSCSPDWPLVLARVVDDGTIYLRLLDLSLFENSCILMDLPGLAQGAVVSKSLLVYSVAGTSELHGLQISPPMLSVPSLTRSEFTNLTAVWHTNIFNITVVAANRQGAVMAPTLVLRRMVHHELKPQKLERDPMAPWSVAMWCVYLVLVGVITVATVRAYALGKFS